MKRFALNGVVVDYVVLKDRRCVFTGVDPSAISILSAAECIVRGIAEAEKRDIASLRFFDLQTCTSYLGFDPGDYELNELIFKTRKNTGIIENVWWAERECPFEIQEIFKQHIKGRISPRMNSE